MGQASILLLLGSLAFVKGCTFKENAEGLISVGYFTDRDGNTAVDRIEVKMRDRGKFVNLMDGCTRPRSKKIKVEYRVKGTSVWNEGGKKTLSSNRPISLESLNPCKAYEVQVTVVNEPLNVFTVGPFYNDEYSNVYLHEGQENENYEAYSRNPLDHIEIVSEESSAKILVTGFCARTIVLEVQAEGEVGEPTQVLLQNDLKNPSTLEAVIPELNPCTKYQIILDLFLNKKDTLEAAAESDEVDYINQNFATFYTMPTMEGLDEHYSFDPEAKTLTWDFNPFFKQQCANSEPTNIENIFVTLIEGQGMAGMDLAGSKKLVSECGRDLRLQVEYDKQENKWSRNVTVFNEFVSGDRGATEESFIVENEHLALTVDPCLADPDMVEFVPLIAADQVPAIKLTTDELRSSHLVSEVGWVGCLDYEVRIHRSGQEVKQLNELKHPGWKTALDGITLQVLASTNDSVELRKPDIFWEDRAIKMEVVCNGSLNDNDTVEFDFEVDEPLEVTELMSNTEYECKARLFKDEESTSGWSDVWSVSTLETGEEPQTFSEEPRTVPEPVSDPAVVVPVPRSSGNLNFASFISLTALVSTTLRLATTSPF